MRLIYQTPPVAVTFTDARSGDTLRGYASFCVYAHDPDEELPGLSKARTRAMARSLSELRAEAGPGRPIVAKQHPQSKLRGVLPEAITIPDLVLTDVRPETLLRFAWSFGPDAGGRQ